MENFVKFWVPIGAIIISIVSLWISLSNSRFNKRFEAAKKRTEFLSLLLQSMINISIKREEIHSALRKCQEAGCPKNMTEDVLARYDEIMKTSEGLYSIFQQANYKDPIKTEFALATLQKDMAKISIGVKGLDKFIAKSKECAEEREKESSKS